MNLAGLPDRRAKHDPERPSVADDDNDLNNNEFNAAYTFTDSSGRFTLCGLPQDAVVIEAQTGRWARATVPSDQTYVELDVQP